MTTPLAIAMTIIAWASAFPVIRDGLTAFGPIELGALRFLTAAVPAALYLALTRPPWPHLREIWRFLVGGLCFIALYTVLLNTGERTVPAGSASFIINVSPILTAGLAMAVLGERFGPLAWIGSAVSFAGVGVIALGDHGGLRLDAGALLILGAALCVSATTIVQKPLFASHRPLVVSAWNMMLGAGFLAPALPRALAEATVAAPSALADVVYLGLVPGLIAYGAWSIALSRLPAARAAGLLYCVPPVATGMGYLWLGETPTLLGLIGGGMSLAGVALVSLRR